MAIPQLITRELFEKAFQTFFNNKDVRIVEYKSDWAVPIGDNFTSDLLRSSVTYNIDNNDKVKTISVLVKISPEGRDGIVDTIKEMQLFQKEIDMYTKILPEVYNVLGKVGSLSAQCLYTVEYPVPMLIIEDLIPLEYKMLDRREGLDLEHCLLVMKKIAKLHAASMMIYGRNPTAFSKYKEAMFRDHPFIVNWINIAIDCIMKACAERPGMHKYIHKLEQLKVNFFDKCREAIRAKPEGLNVLNHGDCWTNNFMFLYDANGKLKDLKLIDYQLSVYSGPGLDLQYFWSTTPNMSVRHEHFDTVINYYYEKLVNTLIKLDYPREKLPLRKDIYDDFCSKSYYGFAGAVTTLPLIKSDSRKDASLEELLKPLDVYEGSFRQHVYTNSLSWEHFGYMLPFLDKLGIFD